MQSREGQRGRALRWPVPPASSPHGLTCIRKGGVAVEVTDPDSESSFVSESRSEMRGALACASQVRTCGEQAL